MTSSYLIFFDSHAYIDFGIFTLAEMYSVKGMSILNVTLEFRVNGLCLCLINPRYRMNISREYHKDCGRFCF